MSPAVPPLPLGAYAGRYGADRQVLLCDGSLFVQRGEGPPGGLLPLEGSRFALADDPATQFLFRVGGERVTALAVERIDGSVETVERRGSE